MKPKIYYFAILKISDDKIKNQIRIRIHKSEVRIDAVSNIRTYNISVSGENKHTLLERRAKTIGTGDFPSLVA